MRRLSIGFLVSACALFSMACNSSKESADSVATTTEVEMEAEVEAEVDVCETPGQGCLIVSANGSDFCLETVSLGAGALDAETIEADCLEQNGTLQDGGCPEADKLCTIVSTEEDDILIRTHIYVAGEAEERACSVCASDSIECC
ncbi:MAG TPA: hypothetical protein DFR83_02335 [Deltaproteobacteria bacterium]|nr:hypothetical protein [Deltaproteobacteria bacterium]